jgi:hypothetical protein
LSAYTVEFVRVPPEEMSQVGLAVLYRAAGRTIIYCRADHIAPELARSMSEQGTRYSRSTVRADEPVAPIQQVRMQPAELPEDVAPIVSKLTGKQAVTYYSAGMMTDELARALELVCSVETQYFVRLPVISPEAEPGATLDAR